MTTHIADEKSAAHPLSRLTVQNMVTGEVATDVAPGAVEQARTLLREVDHARRPA